MSLKFKYQEDYDKLTHTCPPDDFTSKDLNPVFRWVFNPMEDERNFVPQYHRNPKRFLNKDDATKCKAMGLSMFVDLNDSIHRFNELKKQIGANVYRTLGDKIAQGSVIPIDGVNGTLEWLGHFTHHTSEEAQFEKVFKIIQDIP